MFGLRCRSGRLRRQLITLRRQMASEVDKESPAQQERRIMDEEQQKQQLEYYSVFELLRPSKSSTLDYMRRLNAEVSFTRQGIINLLEDKIRENRILDQRFLEQRHQTLGFDLAAAHFIIARGGRVRFQGDTQWVKKTEEGRVPLPGRYRHGLYVEELDTSGTEIVYEGLENFIQLSRLRALYLRDCEFVDDWCLDRVCGEFRHHLHHLDVSGCRRVTERGLEGIAQLKHLKTLTVERMDHIRLLPYICLLLEDTLPDLVIRGVDVMQPPPEVDQSLVATQADDQSAPAQQAPPPTNSQSRSDSTAP